MLFRLYAIPPQSLATLASTGLPTDQPLSGLRKGCKRHGCVSATKVSTEVKATKDSVNGNKTTTPHRANNELRRRSDAPEGLR
jgi:hypothetical protein